MTTATAHPGHHLSPSTATLAVAGTLLAVGAGFGIANLVLDNPQVGAPASQIGGTDTTYNDLDRYPGFDPNGFAGTDREERALMHRY